MKIVDRGTGAPVVLVPGIQGRWEWMAPAVDALAARCRVITFSLADEPTAETAFDAEAGFDAYVAQVADVLDARGLQAATICGVSYGGLIAAAFSLRHPHRVSGLALVSALPPSWTPDARAQLCMRAPRLMLPAFLVNSLRLYEEIAAANSGAWRSVVSALRQGARALTHFPDPARMARRARLADGVTLPGLAAVHVPTLVVTGEPRLDRVVPTALTEQYLRIWPHAERVILARTGHLGLITRPEAFADVLVPFVHAASQTEPSRRRVG